MYPTLMFSYGCGSLLPARCAGSNTCGARRKQKQTNKPMSSVSLLVECCFWKLTSNLSIISFAAGSIESGYVKVRAMISWKVRCLSGGWVRMRLSFLVAYKFSGHVLGVSMERWLPCYHLVKYTSQSPEVGPMCVKRWGVSRKTSLAALRYNVSTYGLPACSSFSTSGDTYSAVPTNEPRFFCLPSALTSLA